LRIYAHVFCSACLDEWLVAASSARCPTCNADLGARESHAPLRVANPLAWRVLSRVQCRCPLSVGVNSANACPWVGDYSEVHAHLTASESAFHGSDKARSDAAAAATGTGGEGGGSKLYAEALKAQGNAKFEARAFEQAAELYSKALLAQPTDAALLCNRAASHLMLDNLDACITDCRAALALKSTYIKAHLRLAQVLCRQGRLRVCV
jgi:DnaJ homolog subfamily C member 7